MADGDKITIDQINWDDSNLPKWATEETQRKIALALGAIKKTDEKTEKEGKKQTKEIQSLSKRFEDSMRASNENSKKLISSLNKKGKDYTEDIVKKNVKTPFKSVNNAITKFAGKLGIAGAIIGGLATAVSFVIGRLKQFSDAYRQAFSMGFRFSEGAMGLSKAAVAAEMGIGQFTELLSKYSTSAGLLGVNSLQDLTIGVKDTLQPLGLLGMSLDELAEYTVDYADQLRVAGLLEGKSNEELEKLVVNYAQNITAFSQLANVSREQISQVIKSSTSIEAFTNKLNVLPAVVQTRVLQAAQTITGMFAGLGTEFGDQLATTFTTAYGRGGLFFTQAGRELLAVNRELYNSMSGIIDNMNSLDDAGAAKATADLIDQIANTSEAERERLGLIERSNSQFAGAARQQIALINQVQQIQKNGAIEQFKDLKELRRTATLDKLAVGFINFERVVAKLRTAFNNFFNSLFGDEKLIKQISAGIEKLGEVALTFADNLKSRAGDIGESIANAIDKFRNFMKEMEGKSFLEQLGTVLGKALAIPFQILGNIIRKSIQQALQSAMSTFFGGDYDDERDDYHDLRSRIYKSYGPNAKYTAHGGPGDAGVSHSQLIAEAEMKLAEAKATGNTYAVKNAQAYLDRVKLKAELAEKDRKEAEAELEKFKNDMRMKYGDTIDFTKSFGMSKSHDGTIVHGNAKVIDNTPEGSNVNKGTLTETKEPQSLTDAKMRIMKQYLPMTGGDDPLNDPTANYYEKMIIHLEEQLKSQTDQITVLKEIATNTK